MGNNMRILGIKILPIDTNEAYNRTREYLNDEYLNVVYFAGTKACLYSEENEFFRNTINDLDMILPADELTTKAYNDKIRFEIKASNDLSVQKPFSKREYINKLLGIVEEESKNIYIIGNSESQKKEISEIIIENYPFISVRGSYLQKDNSQQYDIIVNDINSMAPDIIVLGISNEEQEKFISEYRLKLNSRLCLCMGDMLENYYIMLKEVPEFYKKFKLEKLYRWLIKRKKVNTTITNSEFKKHLKQEGDSNGDMDTKA